MCGLAVQFRGRAHMMLGDWLAANKDLAQSNSIDCNEEVSHTVPAEASINPQLFY